MKIKSLNNNLNVTKPRNLNKSSSKGLTKKNVMLGLIASTMVAVPATVGIAQIAKTDFGAVEINGKKFSSAESVENHIKNNSQTETYQREGNNSKWTVTLNGTKQVFDTPEALREFLFSNQIQSETYTTSLDLEQYVDKGTGILGMDDSIWAQMEKDNTKAVKETVYEKSNGGFTTDSEEAIKSHFEVKDGAYYFNNMYFDSKETLRNYLVTDYLPNNTKSYNSLVIQAPNGAKSNPISLENVSPIGGAYKQIEQFINANSQQIVTYTNSVTNKKVNFTANTVDQVMNDISVSDLTYKHVQSSQGESRYVVDNSIEDQHNLIGPYFYKGNLDVGSFTNKNMWKKVNGVSKQVYQESAVDQLVGTFFTTILNDDNRINALETQETGKPRIFRTSLLVENNKNMDEWFLEQFQAYDVNLYREIVSNLNSLMKGKKFNTFYKIPVMYSFIMQRLIENNAPESMINLTVNYFTQVCNFLQDEIDIVFLGNQKLLTRSSDGKKFNLKDFFQIGSSEFDLSTSTEYFLQEIKTYDRLIAGMSAFVGALNNINMLGGLMAFSGYDQSYLQEFKIIDKEVFYQDYQAYENIFVTFSNVIHDDFVRDYVTYSQDPKVQAIDETASIQSIRDNLSKIYTAHGHQLKSMAFVIYANAMYLYTLAEYALQAEIIAYIDSNGTLDPNGFLAQLGQIKAHAFVDYYRNFSESTWRTGELYQHYLAISIDIRNQTNIFNSHQSIANRQEFNKNIGRLVYLSLGATAGVGYTISKLHDAFSFLNTVTDAVWPGGVTHRLRSVFSTVKDAVSNRWTAIKHRMPWVMRGFDLQGSAEMSWSSFSVHKLLDKAGDVFSIVAPILGTAIAGFEIFMIVFELLQVTQTKDYYVYTTADGTEFIWDGGMTTSRFFGLEVKQQSGIDSMKLVDPVQITKPQITEFYYFNQVRYYDINELKKDQLHYIATSDDQVNSKFNKGWSFDNVTEQHVNIYKTQKELVNAVLKDMNITFNGSIYDYTKINKSSKYVSNAAFVLGSGIGTSTGHQNEAIADNIVKYLRPTLIAQLPTIQEGKAVAKAKEQFVYPGIEWKNNGTTVDNSDKAAQYVTDNSANELASKLPPSPVAPKANASNDSNSVPLNGLLSESSFKEQDRNKAVETGKTNLFNTFKSKFTVNQKTVLKSDSIRNNEFSKLSTDIQEKQVFKATLPSLGTKYFVDQASAQRWILKNVDLTKDVDTITETAYLYNGMYFRNEAELKLWAQNKFEFEKSRSLNK